MRKHNKKWYTIFSAIIVVAVGLFLWVSGSNQFKGEMTEEEFGELADKEMEIVDTSVFIDEELESWYQENRKEAGEYLHASDDGTYILVSVGVVEEDNTFLLLNGLKEVDNKLFVGYDTLTMDDVPNVEFEDNIRSTLVKVKGNYDKVEVISVVEDTP